MSKLTDAELSLAVAMILWPEYKWLTTKHHGAALRMGQCVELGVPSNFNHTTDDALGKMCKWLANSSPAAKYRLCHYLIYDNPNRVIAEAIVEAV